MPYCAISSNLADSHYGHENKVILVMYLGVMKQFSSIKILRSLATKSSNLLLYFLRLVQPWGALTAPPPQTEVTTASSARAARRPTDRPATVGGEIRDLRRRRRRRRLRRAEGSKNHSVTGSRRGRSSSKNHRLIGKSGVRENRVSFRMLSRCHGPV